MHCHYLKDEKQITLAQAEMQGGLCSIWSQGNNLFLATSSFQ